MALVDTPRLEVIVGPSFIPDGTWSLNITCSKKDDPTPETYTITFNADGTVDPSSDILNATALLAPSIAAVKLLFPDNIDFWQILNWYYVSFYWTVLYQFGDITPTMYQQNNDTSSYIGLVTLYGMGSPNFSAPINFPPTNNIFWNDTLFQMYSGYLRSTLLPLALAVFPGVSPSLKLPPFLPLSDTNRLERSPTTILTTYQCNELELKGWANALISIVVAISSLWTGGYGILLFILEKLQNP
jgi:hypothetical protein